jgi:hypothetical protein
MDILAAIIFGFALAHTFAAKTFERLAHKYPKHAGLLHFFGEVEVVFGLWAVVLIVAMAFVMGGDEALMYAETRQYTEPLFVFVIMVVAASKPVLKTVESMVVVLARLMPLRTPVAQVWLSFALVPLIGSLITEPAAMTLAALMLLPQIFNKATPERIVCKYFHRWNAYLICRATGTDGGESLAMGQCIYGHSIRLEGRYRGPD